MSMKPEFFITLPSNVKSRGSQETNVVTNYKTTLKERFVFPPNEKWSVGLAEIMYTKSWYNVTEADPIIFIDEKGNIIEFGPYTYVDDFDKPPENIKETFNEISPGYYPNVEELIKCINTKIKKSKFDFKRFPKLFYDDISKMVIMRVGLLSDGKTHFIPVLGEEIEKILGLVDFDEISFADKIRSNALYEESGKSRVFHEITESFKIGYFTAPRIADIKSGINAFHIYTDIVQHSCIGDAYAQLLRTIPVNETAKWGEVIHLVFNKPHLIPLQTRNFDTIEIDIRDDRGSKIPFQLGRVIVKLIFKKND